MTDADINNIKNRSGYNNSNNMKELSAKKQDLKVRDKRKPRYKKAREKCATLFKMLTEEHATKVQEIINEAFGNSEINKEQYKENFDKAKGVDLPHIKLLAATFKNKSQGTVVRAVRYILEILVKNDDEGSTNQNKIRRIGSEKEKKIENVPTRPAKEISDDKVLDKSNWVILVEDRSEDNKEDILEVKEFRKMNKWNEESELTIIEYSKIEGMLNKSANNDNEKEIFNIGFCYQIGINNRKKEALKWYLKSAEEDKWNGQFHLREFYNRNHENINDIKDRSDYDNSNDSNDI
ncbi:hypothetical protein C2G38_2203469 [Gigaspora rosea]|uniref:Uncharacterized protein n=1 Tax=Gigaspora rosea TaxID=44941 RepID=A0A397UW26_9GLOM|nr:hypothetical protein C2G38_2203469 [Gigaspora rosea]